MPIRAAILLALLLAIPHAAFADESAATVDIGSKKQFWFNAQPLVSESKLLRIYQQRPQKYARGPILVADKPWEGTLVQLYSPDVIRDHKTGRGQMWYEGHPGLVLMCTAFSKDGVHWEKPNLGLDEWHGSKDNNIVLQTGYTDAHAASVVVAPTEKDPARKYKMYYWVAPSWAKYHLKPMGLNAEQATEAQKRLSAYPENGHYVAFSADGIHFTPQTKAPAIRSSDYCTVMFDAESGKYRSYHKLEDKKPGWKESRRAMAFAESDDGITFTKSKMVLSPDDDDDKLAATQYGAKRVEFYGVHVWPTDGFYLGLLWVFTVTGGNDAYGRGWDDGKIQPHLIYSADGIDWKRLPVREPFIPSGPAGSFDSGTLYSSGNGPNIVGDEFRFYYFGCDYTHGSKESVESPKNYDGVNFATLPRDRYVAWHGATVPGTLTTKPIKFSGSEIHVNLDASRGETQVVLLDADGKTLAESEAISADGLDQIVKWKDGKSLSGFGAKPVRLRFTLRHSMLYTWQFK
jgi:hypothetical protein